MAAPVSEVKKSKKHTDDDVYIARNTTNAVIGVDAIAEVMVTAITVKGE